ncbi:MAG TPA: nucleoside triphosphate hydrolase, partial [Parachlamydiaceae bacterium]|nr:nucleoside triphosphate hydrolase [Parachlamydiaceae bacterium]
PEHQGVPAHQHIDFCYIARPIGGQLKENKTETDGIRWFSEEKIDKLQEEHDIFLETKLVIKKILSDALVKEACL